jgi:alpha-D-ribose 1-methylphosphonate 5-triphosphate synthase subunit PhnH
MFGLSFLSPAFLFGALLAAVPVALHLLGRRPRVQVPFAAVRLLERMPAEQTRRRRVRDLLLLALRVAALVLLALAFARPYVAGAAHAGGAATIVVAVDCSFSMSAPGQFDRARSAARAAVSEVPAATPVALVSFDDEASVVLKPTTDRAALEQAIGRLHPGYGATSYSAALARAAEIVGPNAGRAVVVTDLQRSGWDRNDAAIPDRIDVRVRDVGSVASNLSVSDLRREDDRVAATVRNSGSATRAGKLRLVVAGRLQAVQPFTVPGGAVQRIAFPTPAKAAGEMSVELDDAAGYQADNRAYGLLDPPEPPALLALDASDAGSRGTFYLRQALEVDGGRFFSLEPVDTTSFSRAAGAAYLRRYAAVFVLATRGLGAQAASSLGDYAAAGGGLLVALGDQVDQASLDALLGTHAGVRVEAASASDRFALLPADDRHPLMQPLGPDALAAARFQRVAHVECAGQEVLARFANGAPALTEIRRGRGRVLIFGSDLGNRWNDLPLQPAFLPFVHEVARYLVGGRVQPREFTVAQAPPGVTKEPGIRTMESPASSPPDRAHAARRIVVNVDPGESNTARMTAAEFNAAIRRQTAPLAARAADPVQSTEQQRLWRAAIALAIAALLAEGMLGRTARV